MPRTQQANRQLTDDAGREKCPACGGSKHPRDQRLPQDFRCHWTQYSQVVGGLLPGGQLPYRKSVMLDFANWIEGNAHVRPVTKPDGTLGPYDPDARVRFFE